MVACYNVSMTQWKWYVYVIECNDGLYYTGMTWNIQDRFWQHSAGLGCRFTARHGVKALRYVEEHSDFASARRREHQIKDYSRKKKQALWEGILTTFEQ